jgi:hypothetical protein
VLGITDLEFLECREESKALVSFLQGVPEWMKVPVKSAAVAVYLCR